MARTFLTRACAGFFLLAGIVGNTAAAGADTVAPVRAAPTRPNAPVAAARTAPRGLWPFTEIRGTDYVDARDLAARFGLKAAWTKPEVTLTLSDKTGVRFTFEAHQRDFYFDGLRIFLGRPALADQGVLWLSKLDVIKLVAPLFDPAEHAPALPVAPRLIVLDPGHGGIDPGNQNRTVGVNEKTFTLDVALRLKKILEAQGYRVVLTREKDVELSKNKKADLQLRDELANRLKADLFLSIHFNAVERDAGRVTGIETYALTPQFMFSAGDDNGDDMTRVAFPGNKLDFANLLLGEQMHRALLAGLKTPDRGYKRARFAVLRMLDCPGVLVESAYLSNDAEARRVATPEFRQQIAEGLATGIQNYARALAILRAMASAK